MNERNEKWLDEQLKKTVDSGKVEFDSEQWKQKYSSEYEALVSRAEKRPNVLRFLWARPLLKAAAVIAVMAIVIFFARRPEKHIEPTIAAKPEQSILRSPDRIGTATEDRSPAVMLSRLSLMLAYKQGGLDEVDEQSRKAFELLGQKNINISIGELLNGNGAKPERKDL